MKLLRLAQAAVIAGACLSIFSGKFHLGGELLQVDSVAAYAPNLPSPFSTLSLAAAGEVCYDFDDGQLPPSFIIETTTSGGSSGQVSVEADYPLGGSGYSLDFYTSCGGGCTGDLTRQAAVIPYDLTGETDVAFSFWGWRHADEPHAEDGIFISDNAGSFYEKVYDISQLPNAYQAVTLDIDALASAAGQSLNDQFQIKIQSYDNSGLPADGFSFDEVCLCTAPTEPIPLTVQQIGGDFNLAWSLALGEEIEIWYAANQPNFLPDEDCANPTSPGVACQLVSGGTATLSNLIDHPEYSYTFLALARNTCGQRTPVEVAKRTAVMKFGFSSTFAADLHVELSAPEAVIYTSSADLFAPITQTITYTNKSMVYTAASPVLTYTMPSYFVLVGSGSYPWGQVNGSSTFTLPINSLAPGASGTAIIEMIPGERLAGSAAPRVEIGDLAAPTVDPISGNNIQSRSIQLLVTPDSDGDGLPDWMEDGSLIYNSPNNPGTDPLVADTDGDGLNDGDEVRGSAAALDLPAMGVHPLQQTILLEYDWLINNSDAACLGISHQPTAAALQEVSDAFAAAPTVNPDGSTGIQVIHDFGQGGIFSGGNLVPDADGVIAGGVGGVDFAPIKATHMASNRLGYFHYVLMPHRFFTSSNSSGQAELPGDDMIVSLQCYNSEHNVAHTVMHELGHNLGLRHGGDTNTNRKPNYNSVMNYRYQFPGVDTNCTPDGDGALNYSSGGNIVLNESILNEYDGICGSAAAVPWDWNGNSAIEGSVTIDINSDGDIETLTDYNDWANINFGFNSNVQADSLESPVLVLEDELPDHAKSGE